MFLSINLWPTHKSRPTRRSHIQVWKKQLPLLLRLPFSFSANQWRWLGQSSSFSSLFSSLSYTSSLLVKVGSSDTFHYNAATSYKILFPFISNRKKKKNRTTSIVVEVQLSRIREHRITGFWVHLIFFALQHPHTRNKHRILIYFSSAK